jgi:hypothetical protein
MDTIRKTAQLAQEKANDAIAAGRQGKLCSRRAAKGR